jgi:hypothetical protein
MLSKNSECEELEEWKEELRVSEKDSVKPHLRGAGVDRCEWVVGRVGFAGKVVV